MTTIAAGVSGGHTAAPVRSAALPHVHVNGAANNNSRSTVPPGPAAQASHAQGERQNSAEGRKGPGNGPVPDATAHLTTTERLFFMGELTYLFLNSPLHQRYAVAQLATYLVTPLRLDQCRIYRNRTHPVGFVAWAYLTDEVSDAYASGTHELVPEDWNAGTNRWIIEFIAPFGHARRIVRDLRHNVFPSTYGQAIRRKIGKPPRLIDCFGASYEPFL